MLFRCFAVAAVTLAAGLFLQGGLVADGQNKKTPKEALQACGELIGSWRGTAEPGTGTKQQKLDNSWVETITWAWQFKDKDVWLAISFDKSKHFTKGTMRYLPEKDEYVLALTTVAKAEKTFKGQLSDKTLTLEGQPDAAGDVERLVFTLLHDNRHLYRFETKKAERASFTTAFKVGATKEGVEFAGGSGRPECIVTGGLGTQTVSYNGTTYYVCCGGCADEFRSNPAKYVKEYEEKKKKK